MHGSVHGSMRNQLHLRARTHAHIYTSSGNMPATKKTIGGDADYSKDMTKYHVLEIGDGEGNPRLKGIDLQIHVRDVPIR